MKEILGETRNLITDWRIQADMDRVNLFQAPWTGNLFQARLSETEKKV
jgi:hypothetical protein